MAMLKDKVVIVTGSSRGLGLAIARACAAEGAAVVVSSRSAGAVDRAVADLTAAGAQAAGWPCDISDLGQVEALSARTLDRFGRFDVWVNNGGIAGVYGPAMHIPPQDFLAVINTNIVGTYHGSLVALRHFYPRRSGKLINILGRGSTGPVPFQNAYTASKIWVRSFTKALAQEYRDSGIGIIAYNPGLMLTEMMTGIRAIKGYEGRLEPLKVVLRMFGNPPDVPARKAAWLASAATDGKTGLVVRQLTPAFMMRGALREGLRRLLGGRLFGDPGPEIELHVESVLPAMPLHASEMPAAARPRAFRLRAGTNGHG